MARHMYGTEHRWQLGCLIRLARKGQHTLVSPAGLASIAGNRTLNTWRKRLQVHLLLTTRDAVEKS